MMKRVSLLAGALGLAALLAPSLVRADVPAIGLFSTGSQNTDSPPGTAQVDNNWTIGLVNGTGAYDPDAPPAVASPSANAFRTDLNSFPHPPWADNDTGLGGSKWISPRGLYNTSDPSLADAPGFWVAETSFTILPNTFNLANSTLTFDWWNDNLGIDILVNGVSIRGDYTLYNNESGTFSGLPEYIQGFDSGPSGATPGSADQAMQGFLTGKQLSGTIAGSLLTTGVNKVQFIAWNEGINQTGNPLGTRVRFGGSLQPIPEPAFYQMSGLLLGGGLLALRLRKRNKDA